MATGDLHGNLERLRVQLQSIHYPHAFDVQGHRSVVLAGSILRIPSVWLEQGIVRRLSRCHFAPRMKEGIPAVMLPLIHHALLGYSRHLARFLSANGYELWAKSDLRFMESTLKFLRQEFSYRSALTMAQIFARGYAERKLLFLCDVIQMCKRKHLELLKLVHEKKVFEKVNIDPSHLATARRACEGACAPSSQFLQTKPWKHTLRKPEGKVPADTTGVLPVKSDSAPQAVAPNARSECHPQEISEERNTGSSMPSPNCEKPAGDDSSQITPDSSPRAQPHPPHPSSISLSFSHDDDPPEQNFTQDFHEELCRKIVEMADRLEARFNTLEDGVAKARETLQEKLVGLECRVSLLEAFAPRQEVEFDHPGTILEQRLSSEHHQGNGFENFDMNHLQYQNFLPRQENFQPCDCEQHFWIAQQNGPASIVGMNPCFSLMNSRQQCAQAIPAPVLEQHSQTIRDISNTHQHVGHNSLKLRGESYENQCKPYEKVQTLINEKKSSTEGFIADIQARFNKTMELLNQDVQV